MTPLPCILLIDDDQTNNFLNQNLLNRLGVAERLLVALDGQEALAQLREHCAPPTPTCPTLILLDVNMPGMNGVQFLEAYQHLPLARQRTIVILMLTTSLHPRDVERVEQLNLVNGFVSKPLTAQKVAELLHTYFGQALPSG
ncbi:CheY chemotaxis protein or a CheY-like REC (receiver) domain [Hymenobacter daecheongensis DSM 21074]|uniref:CheY chemotaxis protein or a CheY-like REC (Receiver) domain n=1 Tax=Hymenobacter daecheongensis DSM 21074 TaxID=1121955 RepID=A0A1M6K498_9BACT|nr:response regulator [Hymenobacter daecheongensis]SHJ53700.1 CheY chemotaxis protein or a CheY-like REC (receiver) domain [Hymenobacter daecheongensis DSM 21074]